MAIIQTIRDKYAKVAGAVIVLALIGFVLTDLGKTTFQPSTTAAEINGSDIDIVDYNNKANERVAAIKENNQNQPIGEQDEEQIRNEVWNEMVSDLLLEDMYDKLGVHVTDAEFMDMFVGVLPDQSAQQSFIDPQTGQFNSEQAIATINKLETSVDPAESGRWKAYKEDLIKRRLQSKVGNLIVGGMFVPKAVLDAQDKLSNTLAKIEVVQLPYNLVSDDKITVTEGEINEYINKHKEMYTMKTPSLEMDFVTIPYVPSVADSNLFFADMDSMKTLFASASNPEEFATTNSSVYMPAQTLTKSMMQSLPNSEDLLNASVGSIVGPFPFQTEYAIAKILDKQNVPDSVEVRHILVAIKSAQGGAAVRTEAEAKTLIDSLAASVKAGASFDTLAATFSDDDGSKNNGGKYTFKAEQKGSLTKEFADFAFSGNNGETKVVLVKQDNGYSGYHLIEVIKRATTTQVANKIQFITKALAVSDESKNQISEKANQFLMNASKGGAAFDQEAQRLGLTKTPVMADPNSRNINGLGVSAELIKWANKAKSGDVSTVFLINNNYVIAKLNAKNEKGALMLNNPAVKTDVEAILKRKKKAAILAAEYDGKGDINAIATASGQAASIVDSLTFNRTMSPLLNGEPTIVGYIFSPSAVQGQVSKGLEGRNGVFYVRLDAKNTVAPAQARNIDAERKMMTGMYKSNAYRMFVAAKLQDGDIKDFRSKFL